MFYKFKLLGFIHLTKSRPVGNLNYLNLTDKQILSNFSYLYLIIIFWFSKSRNFKQLINFLKFLKESCILTFCRKHNKSRFWVNSVYTSNLVISKNLYHSYSFFPSHIFLNTEQFGFFCQQSFLFIDEAFFICF